MKKSESYEDEHVFWNLLHLSIIRKWTHSEFFHTLHLSYSILVLNMNFTIVSKSHLTFYLFHMELYPHSSVTKWGDRTEDSSKHILHISLPK